MNTLVVENLKLSRWLIGICLATLVWVGAYSQLTEFADMVINVLGLTRKTPLGEAVHFFLL